MSKHKYALDAVCTVCKRRRIISSNRKFSQADRAWYKTAFVCSDHETDGQGRTILLEIKMFPAGPPRVGQWVIAWRTPIMPCSSYWYGKDYDAACEMLCKFLF